MISPPPSKAQEPYHDWQTAVPDTSILPPPPSMGYQRSDANNATEEEALQGKAWCEQNPLGSPVQFPQAALEALDAVTLGLGFVAQPYPTFRLPGWHRGSFGVHGDDGHKYINDLWGGKDFTDKFRAGQTIGIGMTFTPRNSNNPPAYDAGPAQTTAQTPINVEIFFTRDGKRNSGWNLHEEGDSVEDLPVTGLEGMHDLYAAVGTFENVEFQIVFNESEMDVSPIEDIRNFVLPLQTNPLESWSSDSPLDSTAKPFDAGLSNWEQISSFINEVSKPGLPVKPYVFIAIDLEATLEQWEYYPNGASRRTGSGKVYPKQTPTQIGISVLRATGKNAELFTKDSNSNAGRQFCSINIVEFQGYKTGIKRLRAEVSFLYGNSEYVELDKVNELILKLVAELSKHEEVILVGHAIQNDRRFLENGNIYGLHEFFDSALDTQFMHHEPGTDFRSLQDLAWSYDDNIGDGWHNSGNDAMWTLWVFAKKLQDFLTVSESGNEMVIDYSRRHKYLSKKDQCRINYAARLADLRVDGWD
ncbi:hypothetical protein DID88_002863 [Monilinia fructigena]|uniref:Gfd2/YDR514C-like C-terminal domain-containing protein n=1 Tax=Monilinia fructigena TaxID=38457 RepID=A0A395INE1_9HELO|nr:hypothetical protein DID88_002863 [Monilinia fructigena]